MDSIHIKSAKSSLQALAFICSFSVDFLWDEKQNLFLKQKDGMILRIWYFQQFVSYISSPIGLYHLINTSQEYFQQGKFAQLTFNMYFSIGYLLIFSLQFIFLKYRNRVILLVNESLKLQEHFEESKLIILDVFKVGS